MNSSTPPPPTAKRGLFTRVKGFFTKKLKKKPVRNSTIVKDIPKKKTVRKSNIVRDIPKTQKARISNFVANQNKINSEIENLKKIVTAIGNNTALDNTYVIELISMAEKALQKSTNNNNSKKQKHILTILLKEDEINDLIINENSSKDELKNFTKTVQFLKKQCDTYNEQKIVIPSRVSSIDKRTYAQIKIDSNHIKIDRSGFRSLFESKQYWYDWFNINGLVDFTFFVRYPLKNQSITNDNIDKFVYLLYIIDNEVAKIEGKEMIYKGKVSIKDFIIDDISSKLLTEFINQYNAYKSNYLNKLLNFTPSFFNNIKTILQHYMSEPRWIPDTDHFKSNKNNPLIIKCFDNSKSCIYWHGYYKNRESQGFVPYYYISSPYEINIETHNNSNPFTYNWIYEYRGKIGDAHIYVIHMYRKNPVLEDKDTSQIEDYVMKNKKQQS